MAEKLLDVQHVSKTFRIGGMIMGKKLKAVDDITFRVGKGEIVGLSSKRGGGA